MVFRLPGTSEELDDPCWCGAAAYLKSGLRVDGEPWSYIYCEADPFHNPEEVPLWR